MHRASQSERRRQQPESGIMVARRRVARAPSEGRRSEGAHQLESGTEAEQPSKEATWRRQLAEPLAAKKPEARLVPAVRRGPEPSSATA